MRVWAKMEQTPGSTIIMYASTSLAAIISTLEMRLAFLVSGIIIHSYVHPRRCVPFL